MAKTADIQLSAIRGIPEIRPGDDLGWLIARAAETQGTQFMDGDVIVVAVKEALASTERVKRLVRETPCAVLCGEDAMIADFMGLGAVGVIGVVNNVVPAKVRELVRLAVPEGGNHLRAAMLVEEIAPLAKDLFVETNPVPVKAALAMLRKCGDEVRLPLAPLADASRAKLESTLRACKLL